MKPDWKVIDKKMKLYASRETSSEEKANIRSYVWSVLLSEETEEYMFKKFIYTDLKKDTDRNENNGEENSENGRNRAAFIDDPNLRDGFGSLYLELINDTVEKYDPEKSNSFFNYFKWLAVRRGNGLFTGMLFEEHNAESFDKEDDDGEPIRDKIGTPGHDYKSDVLNDTAEWFITFANAIIQAKMRTAAGTRNAEGVFYRSMFYSDTVSAAVREVPEIVRLMSRYNRLLFKAMDIELLDYVFSEQCRRIKNIAECKTKRLCDMKEVNDPSEKSCKIPIPHKVFAGFMESVGKEVSISTISKRQKNYNQDIDDLKTMLRKH